MASERAERDIDATPAPQTMLAGLAAFTGSALFDVAVELLADRFGVSVAFIAVPVAESSSRNRIIALRVDGSPRPTFEYDVDGTPSERIDDDDLSVHVNNVLQSFPDDEWLRRLGADGYADLQLHDESGRFLGQIGLIHTGPLMMSDDQIAELRLVGTRIGAELQREHVETNLFRVLDFQDRFFQSAPFGVTRLNLRTGESYSNPAFEQIVGRSYRECREIGWSKVIHVDDLSRYNEASPRQRVTGETVQTTFRVVRPDGEIRWVQRHGATQLDESGSPIEVITLSVDLTETHRANAELLEVANQLKQRSAELTSSLNAFPDMRMRISRSGNCLSAWAGDPEDLIAPPDELIGSHIGDHLPPTVADKILRAAERTLDTGSVSSVEYQLPRGDSISYYEARLAPIDANEVLAVVRNINEIKALEAQLVHAGTMQSIGRLAGGIAHDFNNVLHVVGGHASALKRVVEGSETTERRLDAIIRAVERTSSLIERLMHISNPALIDVAPLRIDEFLQDLGPTLHQMLGDTVTLEFDLRAPEVHVGIGEAALENILLNLTANARDAMADGGTLVITTRTESPNVRIMVTDSGAGMDEATLAHVFEPFFTTKPAAVGTGLGLTTTYSSISAVGGTISVDSAPGRGTSFIIELPCIEPDPPAEPAPSVEHCPNECRGATVLVVEDEPDVLDLCLGLLAELGYQTLQARSGAEALEVMAEHDDIDGILTDVIMAGMRGTELTEKIRSSHPDIPIVYMSGFSPEAIRVDIPPDRLLPKPFTITDLQQILRRHIVEGRDDHD